MCVCVCDILSAACGVHVFVQAGASAFAAVRAAYQRAPRELRSRKRDKHADKLRRITRPTTQHTKETNEFIYVLHIICKMYICVYYRYPANRIEQLP